MKTETINDESLLSNGNSTLLYIVAIAVGILAAIAIVLWMQFGEKLFIGRLFSSIIGCF